VAPGTYTVTESLPVSGFNLIGLVCADPDNGSSTSLATGRATIDMDAGETIICTYTNSSATASIVIVKDAVPDGPQDFNYITTGGLTPATFTLDDDLDPTRSNTQVYVNLREVNLADVDRIIVAAAAGNDKITLAPTLLVDAVLDGGDGNDTITAAKGNDILLGGAGKDKLLGGGGRDIVIGGLGADTLQGNGVKSKTPVSGDDGDILIAGATAYDGDQAALDRILAEWTSSRSYGDRRQMLMTGGGGLPQLSSSTMVDDAVNESLIGGADLDWFFATPLDKLIDRMLLEAVN
jgi:Ca2+-binding RTX toxin-like protein